VPEGDAIHRIAERLRVLEGDVVHVLGLLAVHRAVLELDRGQEPQGVPPPA